MFLQNEIYEKKKSSCIKFFEQRMVTSTEQNRKHPQPLYLQTFDRSHVVESRTLLSLH